MDAVVLCVVDERVDDVASVLFDATDTVERVLAIVVEVNMSGWHVADVASQ